jgi:hypothetical protein
LLPYSDGGSTGTADTKSFDSLGDAAMMQSSTEMETAATMTPSPVLATPGLNNQAWNRQQAVSVRHAFKTYGSSKNPNHVIQNLNMTVAKGSM